MEILGKRLKELRTARGLSQAEAARGAGLTLQAYIRFERGLRKRGLEELIKLARFFEVNVNYLLGIC